jgi:molybdopterin molybdotransferase
MLTVPEAVQLMVAKLPPPRAETVGIRAALGHVLAEDVLASGDIPPFHRSAMDGYVLRSEDVRHAPVELRVVGEIRAGGGPYESCVLNPGEAYSIMTGAPIPEGADAVQLVELTRPSSTPGRVVMLQPVNAGDNIAPRGSEARHGQVVLESGRLLGAAELAILAMFAHARVCVWSRPRVALFSTGDELVDLDQAPRPDQIHNSNAYSLTAQLRLMGIEPDYLGIAPDNKPELRRFLFEGLKRDIVILTGGVSMGEYDFVKDVFGDLGFELVFTNVAMKPGKPTVFAKQGEKLIFGLPGNPVSSFIAFENFVRPAINTLCGKPAPQLPRISGKLLKEVRQASGRTAYLPAWAILRPDGWTVEPLPWRGSADILGFSRCNATLIFPAGCSFMAEGDEVEAMLLPDFFDRGRAR